MPHTAPPDPISVEVGVCEQSTKVGGCAPHSPQDSLVQQSMEETRKVLDKVGPVSAPRGVSISPSSRRSTARRRECGDLLQSR